MGNISTLSVVQSHYHIPVMPFATIQAVSAPRHRKPPPVKRPPVPAEQRKEQKERHDQRQQEIDTAVAEWFSYTLGKAEELGQRFNKKPRYFMDLFFQGGVRMVQQRSKTNAYNAFKSTKAGELAECT